MRIRDAVELERDTQIGHPQAGGAVFNPDHLGQTPAEARRDLTLRQLGLASQSLELDAETAPWSGGLGHLL